MEFPYGGRAHVQPQHSAPALAVRDVTFHYPGDARIALDRVTFDLQRGEKVAMIGPNGAGKSTLMRAITGLVTPERGSILIYGNPVGACHHRTAYVPQRGEVHWGFPVTVRQVVMMGRYSHLGWLRRPRAADRTAVERAIEAMRLTPEADLLVDNLSGGQQQRVMIARALAQEAELLLLDEPLNNVDVQTQGLIFDSLDRLALEGKTILVSTHDLGSLQEEFDRGLFLDHCLMADGPVDEILQPALLARAYGIDPHVCPPELLLREVAQG